MEDELTAGRTISDTIAATLLDNIAVLTQRVQELEQNPQVPCALLSATDIPVIIVISDDEGGEKEDVAEEEEVAEEPAEEPEHPVPAFPDDEFIDNTGDVGYNAPEYLSDTEDELVFNNYDDDLEFF